LLNEDDVYALKGQVTEGCQAVDAATDYQHLSLGVASQLGKSRGLSRALAHF
jgi:hypothetical protein